MTPIIDTHMHLPGRLFGPYSPVEKVRSDLVEAGISYAWILTIDGLLENPSHHNDVLAREVAAHRDFFAPFCTVNPYEGEDAVLRELDRCKNTLKMRGLKLHPWLQAFPMGHPVVESILRKAGELGFPVLLHDGTPPYSTPLQIAEAAARASDTVVILGHAGLDDLTEDAILACRRQDNIYLSCTSLSIGWIKQILRRCPLEKILYGSDGGLGAHIVPDAIAKIRATGASDGVLRAVFYDNPARLLPLPQA
jgi:uncharacterized protein